MSKKHYVIVAVTLGLIGAGSAGLISATNLITRERIAQNEIIRINNGIKEIFGENAVIFAEGDNQSAGLKAPYQYVNYVYTIADNNEKQLGYAFRVTGSNTYGKISLIIGFDQDTHGFVKMSVIINEQTYASTLVENYIVPVNNGEREISDTSCGATYGAKKIEEMINEAELAARELWGN